MRWVARWLPALLVLAGCGGGEPGAEPARPPAATVAPAPVAVLLDAPVNGAVVRARRGDDGVLRTRLDVRGATAAGAEVALRASCWPRDCRRTVLAGADGRFRATLPVRVRGRRSLSLTAELEGEEGPASIVLVALRAPAAPSPGRQPAAPRPAALGRLAVVGDSLAEGTEPLLTGLLPGWTVISDAKASRPLATGMEIVRGLPRHDVLAISLFTNDDPGATAALEAAVRDAAGRARCTIWATIARPPVGGRSYAAANALLERLDGELGGRVVVVPWAREVARHPAWLAPDGVHGTAEGYAARARLYADAIRSCA